MNENLLNKIPIFKGLSPADFKKLESILEEKPFPAGHQLFHTGDPSEAFYIILSGAVRIVREDGDQSIDVATLREGDFFGEMGVIEGVERNAGAIMAEAGSLFEIMADEFHRFMAINPTISMKIMSTVSKRYRVKARTGEETKSDARAPGEVLSFFSASGGVGNSLLVANLATEIHRLTKKKVCVLDLDLMFGDLGPILNVTGKHSLSMVVDEPEIGLDTVASIAEEVPSGVSVIAAPREAIEAESITADLVRVFLEVLKGAFDYILVDTANTLSEINLTLIESSSRSFYVLTPEVLAIKNAKRWLSILEMVNIDTSELSLIVNKELNADVSIRDDIEKNLGLKIFATLPFDYKSARNTLNKGTLLRESNADGKLSPAVESLAAKLTGAETSTTPAKGEGGLWGRIFGG